MLSVVAPVLILVSGYISPVILEKTGCGQRRDKAEYVYIIISVALIENTVNSHMTHSHIGFMNVFDDPTKLNFLESMVVVI